MNQIIKSYDEAYRIVQQTIMHEQPSMTGINFLTRVEFYLMNSARTELTRLQSEGCA